MPDANAQQQPDYQHIHDAADAAFLLWFPVLAKLLRSLRALVAADAVKQAVSLGVADPTSWADWQQALALPLEAALVAHAGASLREAARYELRHLARVGVISFVLHEDALSLADALGSTAPNVWADTILRAQAAAVAREAELETRRALLSAVQHAFRRHIEPGVASRLIRHSAGLNERQMLAVLNYFMGQFADTNVSAREAERRAKAYVDRLLEQRARLIAATETMRSANAGAEIAWQVATNHGLLPVGGQKRWLTAEDGRVCPRCAPLEGITVPLGSDFPNGEPYPPDHPLCRCVCRFVPPKGAKP